MDRAEAIRVLNATATEMLGCFAGTISDNYAKFMQRRIDAIDTAIAALREQSVTDRHQWVSVDERLPKESGEYLVVSVNGHTAVLDYSTVHKAFNAYDDISCANHAISCTHWMPLPEPPKGE